MTAITATSQDTNSRATINHFSNAIFLFSYLAVDGQRSDNSYWDGDIADDDLAIGSEHL